MKRLVLLTILAGVMSLAHAGSGDKIFHFSGFGTVGIAHSDNDQADYRNSLYQPNGPGATHRYDWGMDSNLGLQLAAEFNPRWSAVVQVLSDRNYDKTFTPELEWANVKFQFNEHGYVRVGRVVAPMFMNSESLHTGFAATMIRNPPDVYIHNPINNLDGLDVGYEWSRGDLRFNTRYNTGVYSSKVQTRLAGVTNLDIRAQALSATVEYNYWSARCAYLMGVVSQTGVVYDQYNSKLQALVDAGVPNAQELKNGISFENVEANFINVGVLYDDPSAVLFQSEYMVRRFNSMSGADTQGWYAMGGYHLGALTPFVSYSRTHTLDDLVFPVFNAGALPVNLQGSAGYVNAINANLKRQIERQTLSLGARYAFAKNFDVKMQWDHIHKPAGASSWFVNQSDSFINTPQKTNVVSIAVDFVF